MSVDAFNDKIFTYLNYIKVFYNKYNNNNNNNNNNINNNNTKYSNNNNNDNDNNNNNNNNKRNVFGILPRKPQDIMWIRMFLLEKPVGKGDASCFTL